MESVLQSGFTFHYGEDFTSRVSSHVRLLAVGWTSVHPHLVEISLAKNIEIINLIDLDF